MSLSNDIVNFIAFGKDAECKGKNPHGELEFDRFN